VLPWVLGVGWWRGVPEPDVLGRSARVRPMEDTVGMVVTVYERTYRDALRPGHLAGIVESQQRPIDEVVVLINNVADDIAHVTQLAQAAVERGEITGFTFVADHLDTALRRNRLKRSRLGARPYLVDYGLVMPEVVSSRWLLGWDAEGALVEPTNWIDPAIRLLRAD